MSKGYGVEVIVCAAAVFLRAFADAIEGEWPKEES